MCSQSFRRVVPFQGRKLIFTSGACQVQSSSKVLGEQVLKPLQEPVPTGWVHLHPSSVDIHFHWSLLRHLQLLHVLDP